MKSPPYRGSSAPQMTFEGPALGRARGCSPLLIAPPLADSSLARLRCAAPCQSRSRATWPPSKYPHPSRAAFAPSVQSRGLSSGGRAGDFSIEIDCSRKADRGLVPHRRLYRLAAAPAKGGVHLPDGVCVEGMTRAVDVAAKVSNPKG